MLTWEAMQSNAFAFAKRWQNAKSEKSESQMFVKDFLAIFGIDDPVADGRFEKGVRINYCHCLPDVVTVIFPNCLACGIP